MTTFTQPNCSFTSDRGNKVEVFNVKGVSEVNGFKGFGDTVRTFARVCGTEVEVERGCSFMAASAVRDAGF